MSYHITFPTPLIDAEAIEIARVRARWADERAEALRKRTQMLLGTIERVVVQDAQVILTYADGRRVRIEAFGNYGYDASIDVVPA